MFLWASMLLDLLPTNNSHIIQEIVILCIHATQDSALPLFRH